MSPVGLSVVTKLSPVRIVGLMMGVWFLSNALGNKLAGWAAGFFGARPARDPLRYGRRRGARLRRAPVPADPSGAEVDGGSRLERTLAKASVSSLSSSRMPATTIFRCESLAVDDYRCSAGPADSAVRRAASRPLALLRAQGQLRLPRSRRDVRARGGLGPRRPSRRRVPLHPRARRAATSACRSTSRPSSSRRSATRREIWRTGGVPPLPELMVLGELAQAAAERRRATSASTRSDCSLAARFVEVVSGRGRERAAAPRATAAAPSRRRSGSTSTRTRRSISRAPRARRGSARSTSCASSRASSA